MGCLQLLLTQGVPGDDQWSILLVVCSSKVFEPGENSVVADAKLFGQEGGDQFSGLIIRSVEEDGISIVFSNQSFECSLDGDLEAYHFLVGACYVAAGTIYLVCDTFGGEEVLDGVAR